MRFFLVLPIFCFFLFGCAPKIIQPEVAYDEKKMEEKEQILKSEELKIPSIAQEKTMEAKIEVEDILKREVTSLKSEDMPFKDIFFDFDSYLIKPAYFGLLDSISEWLKKRKDKNLIIEGHCDERGTYEYNLVLGQKRAEAVKEYLMRKGVEEKRLKVISYGKERPFDPRHTEEAWAKNRRAHFVLE